VISLTDLFDAASRRHNDVILLPSGVARGGFGGSNPPPFASKPFFHSLKVTVINSFAALGDYSRHRSSAAGD